MRSTTFVTLAMTVTIAMAGVMWRQAEAGTTDLHSWDGKIDDGNRRFKVLSDFDDEAVLDKETGLVWERSPGDRNGDGYVDASDRVSWLGAQEACARLSVGNRKGWRLPAIQELTSLIDPTQSNPSLPSGHPFMMVPRAYYWSATESSRNTTLAWYAHFEVGDVNVGNKEMNTAPFDVFAWCVRGGSGTDIQ